MYSDQRRACMPSAYREAQRPSTSTTSGGIPMRRVGVLLANEPSTPRRQQRLGKVFEPIFEPEVAHCRLCDTLMSGIYARGAGGH